VLDRTEQFFAHRESSAANANSSTEKVFATVIEKGSSSPEKIFESENCELTNLEEESCAGSGKAAAHAADAPSPAPAGESSQHVPAQLVQFQTTLGT
jgi:hypothetical protein